jgi:hypothetical protein
MEDYKNKILTILSENPDGLEYNDLMIRTVGNRDYKKFELALLPLEQDGKVDYYISYNQYGKGFPYWYAVSDSRPRTDHSKETLSSINWNN